MKIGVKIGNDDGVDHDALVVHPDLTVVDENEDDDDGGGDDVDWLHRSHHGNVDADNQLRDNVDDVHNFQSQVHRPDVARRTSCSLRPKL